MNAELSSSPESQRLEALSRENDLAGAEETCALLEAELGQVRATLDAQLPSPAAARS